MKKFLLLIFSIILLSSCYKKEREVDISKKQERNGIVYIINESKPYSGKILRKFLDELFQKVPVKRHQIEN